MPSSAAAHSMSSTTKVLVNDWRTLRALIAKITATIKEQQEDAADDPDNLAIMLSDQQLCDALDGPYHAFLNPLLSAYSLTSKIRLKLVIEQNDTLKPHIKNFDIDLPESIDAEVNIASLDKKQRELDELAQQQFNQWQEIINEWQQQLSMQLMMNGATLSDIEINELSQQEPLSELLNRFTDLSLELPPTKNEKYSFADYLKLKSLLILHSAQSRQHKPHDLAELQKLLKPLKGDFKHIAQQETNLIKTQTEEISAIIQ